MAVEWKNTVSRMHSLEKPWQRAGLSLSLVVLSFASYWIAGLAWGLITNQNDSFTQLLLGWDTSWYLSIATNGYMDSPVFGPANLNGQVNWSFFPLYPLAVRAVQNLPFLDAAEAGILLSNVFLFGALYLSFEYVSLTRSESAAISAVVLIALGPYSIYFSTVYTESLYVLLIAFGFYHLQKENWLLCGVAGGLLSATRTTGILFGLPLFVKIVRSSYARETDLRANVAKLLGNGEKVLSLLLVPSGLAAYMTFLYVHVGDALAFSRVMVAYDKTLGNPVTVLIEGLLGNGTFGGYVSTYMATWALIGIVSAMYLLRENRLEEGLFLLASVVLTTGAGMRGLPRYVVGTLIVLFALNDVFHRSGRYKWVIIAWLSALNMILVFLWYAHLSIMN